LKLRAFRKMVQDNSQDGRKPADDRSVSDKGCQSKPANLRVHEVEKFQNPWGCNALEHGLMWLDSKKSNNYNEGNAQYP
jgi:hypothetical protein